MSWLIPVIGILIVACGAWLLFIMTRKRKLTGLSQKKIRIAWDRVRLLTDPVLQIVEADKVLDEALRLLQFKGTLGEKLKAAGPRFSRINDLWSAHKLRNTLVHELKSAPDRTIIERALASYRQALRDLGVD
jgi:hypothetical protein